MRLHHAAVVALVLPGSIAALVTGLYLTNQIGVDFTAGWVVGSILAWLAAFLLGITVLIPAEGGAIKEARLLVDAGETDVNAALRRHVGAPLVVAGEWLQQALMVLFVYLMVVKPG